MPSPTHSTSSTRNALIFRSELLPYSETFIPSQAEKFQIFTPYYAGLKAKKGVELPPARTIQPTARKIIGKLRNQAAIFGLIDPWFEKSVRQIHPELIHAHFEEGGLKALPLAHRLKIPLFLTCHGYDVTVSRYRWQNRPVLGKYYQNRRRALFRGASLYLGISRFICDQMRQCGYPPEKIRLHYIGIDTDKFRPDPTVPKKPMILFVGRLVEKKGCADLLQAMKQVTAQYPDMILKVVGDGPLKDNLEAFAQAEKIHVQFCGIQPPEVIHTLLQASLMLCMPSIRAESGDSEGLGIVNLEAQAVGIPVVGTLHGGIPEAVEHGVTGLLSPERAPNALVENILTLLSDSTLRAKMGLAARARMVQHFDQKQQSGLLEKYYLEFL